MTGYLERGNERLAVYRDRDRPTVVAQEFRSMTAYVSSSAIPQARGPAPHRPLQELRGAGLGRDVSSLPYVYHRPNSDSVALPEVRTR